MFDDPRPELEQDSNLWELFISVSYLMDEQLAYILHGLKSNSGYIMRPEFNKDSLWDNQAEYDNDKKQYLIRCTDKIIECLNRLGGVK